MPSLFTKRLNAAMDSRLEQEKDDRRKLAEFHENRFKSLRNTAVEDCITQLQANYPKPLYKVGDNVILNVYYGNHWRGGFSMYIRDRGQTDGQVYTIKDVAFDDSFLRDFTFSHENLRDTLSHWYHNNRELSDRYLVDHMTAIVKRYFETSDRVKQAIGWTYKILDDKQDRLYTWWANQEGVMLEGSDKANAYLHLVQMKQRYEDLRSESIKLDENISELSRSFR